MVEMKFSFEFSLSQYQGRKCFGHAITRFLLVLIDSLHRYHYTRCLARIAEIMFESLKTII